MTNFNIPFGAPQRSFSKVTFCNFDIDVDEVVMSRRGLSASRGQGGERPLPSSAPPPGEDEPRKRLSRRSESSLLLSNSPIGGEAHIRRKAQVRRRAAMSEGGGVAAAVTTVQERRIPVKRTLFGDPNMESPTKRRLNSRGENHWRMQPERADESRTLALKIHGSGKVLFFSNIKSVLVASADGEVF